MGAGIFARAWLGFQEVRDFTPTADEAPMAAVRFADGFLRLQRIGVSVMLVGIAVFVVAWWVGRRTASEDRTESERGSAPGES